MSEIKKMGRLRNEPISHGRANAERDHKTPILTAIEGLTKLVVDSDKPVKTFKQIRARVGPAATFAVAIDLAQTDIGDSEKYRGLRSAVIRTYRNGVRLAEHDERVGRVDALKNIRAMEGYTWVKPGKIDEIVGKE